MREFDFPYRIDDEVKSYANAYKEKRLLKYYRRQIVKRSLNRELVKNYDDGEFFHLNVHSKFTPLSGVNEVDDIFNKAKSMDMPGIGLTEVGYMSSIPDAYSASKNTGVKFIPGICAYISDYEDVRRRMVDSSEEDVKDHPALIKECSRYRTPTITILCKNAEGYRELLNLNAEMWKDGFYYVPKVTRRMLEKVANGNLIILSGTLIDKFIDFGYMKSVEYPEYGALSAYDYMKWFNERFGNDFYIEVTMRCQDTVWGSDLDRLITQSSLMNEFEKEYRKLRSVITNDVYYVDSDDSYLYRSMMAISRNTTLKRISDYSSELYFKSRAELRATYDLCYYNRVMDEREFEKACDNAVMVGNECSAFVADTEPKLPSVDNAESKLVALVSKALKDKGLLTNSKKYDIDGNMVTYKEQAMIELERFIEKGFASYFLIMRDIVNFSHKNKWQTGPARGSAGGSLVCYLLGITSMDPIKFKLSFNRFLSPSRGGFMLKVSMD